MDLANWALRTSPSSSSSGRRSVTLPPVLPSGVSETPCRLIPLLSVKKWLLQCSMEALYRPVSGTVSKFSISIVTI